MLEEEEVSFIYEALIAHYLIIHVIIILLIYSMIFFLFQSRHIMSIFRFIIWYLVTSKIGLHDLMLKKRILSSAAAEHFRSSVFYGRGTLL